MIIIHLKKKNNNKDSDLKLELRDTYKVTQLIFYLFTFFFWGGGSVEIFMQIMAIYQLRNVHVLPTTCNVNMISDAKW